MSLITEDTLTLQKMLQENKRCAVNNHQSDCLQIGEINRFNEVKTYCCKHYFTSKHRKYYNPNFTKSMFCNNCKKQKNTS